MNGKTGRIFIVILVIAICLWFLYPTIQWYSFVSEQDKELALDSNTQIRDYARGQSSVALQDLQSMESTEPVSNSQYSDALGKSSKGMTVGEYLESDTEQELFNGIEGYYRTKYLSLKKVSTKALQLGLDLSGGMSILLDANVDAFQEKKGSKATSTEISTAIDQDIEVLKNRIDQYGVSEPEIRRQGTQQILIEIAGEPDPTKVDSFLRGKGALGFQLVDTTTTQKAIDYYSEHPSELYNEDGSFVQPDFLPEGRILTGYYTKDDYGIDELKTLSVIYSEVALDGSYIEDVTRQTDSVTTQPTVSFHLGDEGATIFYNFTKEHVKDVLAVVMDGKVKTQATISTALSHDIQITGFSTDEADELAILLKTASLPIEVTIASQQTVGASLGEDAVAMGLKAITIGFILVVVFMFLYYGIGGLVADFALIMNLYMMISILAGFGSTLTLTGIAGLILTLGMAVDANVIIFERIKEELRSGSSAIGAIKLGYDKALWTILDANITTMIAGIVLMLLGSSTVKGFAVTLTIGIISSLFTSLFVTHLIFDIAVKNKVMISLRRQNNGK
ncbi:MAG: protein translocase subunit SecD [Sphaerochaetaceae bacterium]